MTYSDTQVEREISISWILDGWTVTRVQDVQGDTHHLCVLIKAAIFFLSTALVGWQAMRLCSLAISQFNLQGRCYSPILKVRIQDWLERWLSG